MRSLQKWLWFLSIAGGICFMGLPARAVTWGYVPTNAFPGLIFSNPLCISSPPGETNRLFIVEKHGRVVVITNLMAPTRSIFMDISSRVSVGNANESSDVNSEEGMLSMTFDPGYATNRYFYIFYMGTATNGTTGVHDILSRFQASAGNTNQGDSTSETKLIVQYDRASNHNGGDIFFGPDGYLYISVGDEGNEYNSFGNAQHIDQNFFSGILRIDAHKLPGSLTPNPSAEFASTTNYTVPSDNPFVGATSFDNQPVNTSQLRTEFWAVGLRNPWRWSFDPVTGFLYCGDVGQDEYEEVDIITKGGNYGWSTWEGNISPAGGVNTNGQPIPLNPIFPIYTYIHSSQGQCVIGGVVYRGSRFPNLYGSYVFGDYSSGNFWRLNYNGTSATTPQLIFHDSGASGFGVDPNNGDVLYCTLVNGNNSLIKRIVSTNTVPYINAVTLSGTNVIVSGTNGPANGTYSVLVGTNVTFPMATWQPVSTNPFNGSGNFIFTNTLNPGAPAIFYLLRLQ